MSWGLGMGLAVLLGTLWGCGPGAPGPGAPDRLGERDGLLTPCPDTPNCVSSDATDADHRVDPLALAGEPREAWTVLEEVLRDMPRTRIVEAEGEYLHAEVRSFVFRFVDDVEFHLRPQAGVIAVRSASRIGRSDLGVNRRRVESIRQELRNRGVVR